MLPHEVEPARISLARQELRSIVGLYDRGTHPVYSRSTGKMVAVPVTSKERLLFSFRVSHPEPRTSECTLLERLLRVCVQRLFILGCACLLQYLPNLLCPEPLRQCGGEQVRLTEILVSLPHGREQIQKCLRVELRVGSFDIHQGTLRQKREDGKELRCLQMRNSEIALCACYVGGRV